MDRLCLGGWCVLGLGIGWFGWLFVAACRAGC